jgi:hypothetical protein
MTIVLYIYIAVVLLVGLRLFRHMLFKLDRYDWYYNKGDILGSFVFFVVLWPLIVIKPRNLINPTKLFEGSYGHAARMRERHQLLENPPPCGSVIRYRQSYGRYPNVEETYGEFFFPALQVEQELRGRIRESPHLNNDDEGAILKWIKRHDDSLTEPTDVPPVWSRFQYVANHLVRSGHAKVNCLKCGAELPLNKLTKNYDHGLPGWNYDRLVCPNGHNLLVVQKAHYIMGHK